MVRVAELKSLRSHPHGIPNESLLCLSAAQLCQTLAYFCQLRLPLWVVGWVLGGFRVVFGWFRVVQAA